MLKSLTSTPQHLLRAPPQIGVGPPAQYFSEQKQDHFDPSSSRTWSQAFFVNDTFWRPGSDAPIFLCVGLSSHVRPGASVLHVQATRTSLLRAVRTRGAGQLAPGPHAQKEVGASTTRMRTGYAYQSRACLTYRVP